MATNTDIPQGYKATALGIIPQEWEMKTLGQIANVFSGTTHLEKMNYFLMTEPYLGLKQQTLTMGF